MAQARDISDGVHFHAPAAAPVVVPRRLRADVAGFAGRQAELAALAVIALQSWGCRVSVGLLNQKSAIGLIEGVTGGYRDE